MKQKLKLLAVIFLSLSNLIEAATITLRADTWCPFNCDPSSKHPGYMIEIAREIFAKAGHKIDYQILNWARAKQEAKEGKYDGIVGAYKEDAPGFIFPDIETGRSTNILFAKTGEKWRYKGVESLKNVKIGVIKEYSYDNTTNKLLAENNPSFLVMTGEDALDKLIKMLDAGRITAFYEDPGVASFRLKQLGFNEAKFEKIGAIEQYTAEVYIAFSPAKSTSKAYAELLSQGMKELKKSGRIAQILSHYGLKEF